MRGWGCSASPLIPNLRSTKLLGLPKFSLRNRDINALNLVSHYVCKALITMTAPKEPFKKIKKWHFWINMQALLLIDSLSADIRGRNSISPPSPWVAIYGGGITPP